MAMSRASKIGYPRGRLNNKRRPESPPAFSPTVSVERPIVWKDDEAKRAYWKTIHRALGKGLPDSTRSRQHIVRPESLRVVQVQHTVLAEESRDLYRYDQRQVAMERLAGILQERLYQLLQGVPPKLPVELGSLACGAEYAGLKNSIPNAPKQVVVARVSGWRGDKAKYSNNGVTGSASSLQQLASERALYRDAITETNPWLTPDGVLGEPAVTLIEKDSRLPFKGKELQLIELSLLKEELLPHQAMLGDPVVCLHGTEYAARPIELPIRSLDSQLQYVV